MKPYSSLRSSSRFTKRTLRISKGMDPCYSNIDPTNRADLHEGFEISREELVPKVSDEKRVIDRAMAGTNVWPLDPVRFRKGCLSYYYGCWKGPMWAVLFLLDPPELHFDTLMTRTGILPQTRRSPLFSSNGLRR